MKDGRSTISSINWLDYSRMKWLRIKVRLGSGAYPATA
jgi:hypothetical protein